MSKLQRWGEQSLLYAVRPFVEPVWWIADNLIPNWVFVILNSPAFWRGIILALLIDKWTR
jgi:hypothetical protein